MGSPWKMPTLTQCEELIDNTNHTWTTIKGKDGMKFISKTDTSKYIFLPATGEWLVTDDGYEGCFNSDTGDYWSTCWYDSRYAYQLSVYNTAYGPSATTHYASGSRSHGRPVVAVQ